MDRLKTFITKIKNSSIFYDLVYIKVSYGPVLLYTICYFSIVFVISSFFPYCHAQNIMTTSTLPIPAELSRDGQLNIFSLYTPPELTELRKTIHIDIPTLINKKANCNLNLTDELLPEKPGRKMVLMVHANTLVMTFEYHLQKLQQHPIGNIVGAEHFHNRAIGCLRYITTEQFATQLKIYEAKLAQPLMHAHYSYKALSKEQMAEELLAFINTSFQADNTSFIAEKAILPYTTYSTNYFYDCLSTYVSDPEDVHTAYRCAQISDLKCRREYAQALDALVYSKYGYHYADLADHVADLADYYFRKYTALGKSLNTSKPDAELAQWLEKKMNVQFSKKPKLKDILFKKI